MHHDSGKVPGQCGSFFKGQRPGVPDSRDCQEGRGVSVIGDSRPVAEVYAEGQRYLMGEGMLNNALTRLVADLKQHQIDYVVIGAVALMAYGYPRFNEDIDLILEPDGLDKFHRELIG